MGRALWFTFEAVLRGSLLGAGAGVGGSSNSTVVHAAVGRRDVVGHVDGAVRRTPGGTKRDGVRRVGGRCLQERVPVQAGHQVLNRRRVGVGRVVRRGVI